MNILQINKFFYPKGGSERYFFDVSSALEKRGHTVMHFSMNHPKNVSSPYTKYFIDEVDFTRGKSIKKARQFVSSKEAVRKLEYMIEVEEFEKGIRPNIAHLHNIAHQLTPSIITLLRQKGIPIVQTLHDYQLICPNYQLFTQNATCQRCMKHQYWNAIRYNCVQDSKIASTLAAWEMTYHNVLKKSYERGVNQFIAPSKFLYELLLKWGWSKEQVTYLPHFVEKQRDTSIQKKKQILFAGRLSHEKGADLLLDAASKYRDVEVLFAGEGPQMQKLQEIITAEKLTHCRLLRFQKPEQIDRLMQESLAVVVPSVWYENAPLVVYEALALGTPVIAARHGGLVELIEEGKNGYFFEPANAQSLTEAIQRAVTEKPLHIGQNQYTEEFHIQHLEQLYAKYI